MIKSIARTDNGWQKIRPLFLSIGLFVLAFVPRAIYSISPNLNWYVRSIRFWDAILNQDWIGTYQQYHPGVTTMWVSGFGIKIFSFFSGYSSEELLAIQELPAGVPHQAMNAGVIGLALVLSLGIVVIYILLARLIDKTIAFSSAFLIAVDPFHISQSKSLHLDAMISILMVITLLLLLSYKKDKSIWILISSGIFTGFALLTKSPTALLIPLGTLIITSGQNLELPSEGSIERWRVRFVWILGVIKKLIIWGGTIAATFFISWPAMWVAPQEMLLRIRDAVFFHTLNPHPNAFYFNGTISFEDPGAIYYFAVLLWRTTPVTFLLLILGLVFLVREILQNRIKKHSTILWIILLGALFFVQMLASAKKGDRYILPVFPTINILAAFGLVYLGYFVQRKFDIKNQKRIVESCIGVAFILQIVLVYSLHPYYGNSYNQLFGGIQTAERVFGLQTASEGIDLAGQYLNSLPDSSTTVVSIYDFGGDMIVQHYGGIVEIGYEDFVPESDYRVYYTNQIIREIGGEAWQEAWKADSRGEPEKIIEFNQIPFVWIYKTPNEQLH